MDYTDYNLMASIQGKYCASQLKRIITGRYPSWLAWLHLYRMMLNYLELEGEDARNHDGYWN